jgi:hypothetical protein
MVCINVNVATTVQSAVIGPVVYVVPLSEPLQPVTVEMLYPEFGVTVNWVAFPDCTEADGGLIEPPDPALAVTV